MSVYEQLYIVNIVLLNIAIITFIHALKELRSLQKGDSGSRKVGVVLYATAIVLLVAACVIRFVIEQFGLVQLRYSVINLFISCFIMLPDGTEKGIKKLLTSRQATFINLKSNTMKNTVQIYSQFYFLTIWDAKNVGISYYLTIERLLRGDKVCFCYIYAAKPTFLIFCHCRIFVFCRTFVVNAGNRLPYLFAICKKAIDLRRSCAA